MFTIGTGTVLSIAWVEQSPAPLLPLTQSLGIWEQPSRLHFLLATSTIPLWHMKHNRHVADSLTHGLSGASGSPHGRTA